MKARTIFYATVFTLTGFVSYYLFQVSNKIEDAINQESILLSKLDEKFNQDINDLKYSIAQTLKSFPPPSQDNYPRTKSPGWEADGDKYVEYFTKFNQKYDPGYIVLAKVEEGSHLWGTIKKAYEDHLGRPMRDQRLADNSSTPDARMIFDQMQQVISGRIPQFPETSAQLTKNPDLIQPGTIIAMYLPDTLADNSGNPSQWPQGWL